MQTQSDLSEFRTLVATWYGDVKGAKVDKLYDSSSHSVSIANQLLSEIFELNDLRYLDEIKANYPAIDIGDVGKKVCFQITSNENYEAKIKDTINRFISHELNNVYDELFIFFITYDIVPFKRSYQQALESFTEKHILTLTDIIRFGSLFYNDSAKRDKFYKLLTILRHEYPKLNRVLKESVKTKPFILDEIDNNRATLIFTDVIKRNPVFCKGISYNNKKYIVGMFRKEITIIESEEVMMILHQIGQVWQVKNKQDLNIGIGGISEIYNNEFVIINDILYLFFERTIEYYGNMFRGLQTVEFSLLNIENEQLSGVKMLGRNRISGIEGDFEFDSIDMDSEEGRYIEGKISNSSRIYTTPEDYDLSAAKNHEEKWIIDNPDFYNSTFGRINIHYYQENILIHESRSIADIIAEEKFIENEFYFFYFDFMSPILGLRKADNTTFVALVPEGLPYGGGWGVRSIEKVEFLSFHKIKAYNGGNSWFILDLENSTYERSEY